jgi:hypothetical protein
MILKKGHLYRLDCVHKENYKDYGDYKGYVLTCPKEDVEWKGGHIHSFAHVDVVGTYNENSSIYFSNDDWFIKPPSVSDIIELIRTMRQHKSELKYNFKDNKIFYESNR